MPILSFNTFAIGARQLVVHEAFEITVCSFLSTLWFTPYTTVEEINKVIKEAADGAMKGVLAYTEKQLVSIDYNHDPASSTYDATLTRVSEGTLVKVCSWYDNEWGFSNRMADTAIAMAKLS